MSGARDYFDHEGTGFRCRLCGKLLDGGPLSTPLDLMEAHMDRFGWPDG